MAYQVIARRWRPQTFEEVVFQDHVSKTLQNSIKNGRISHAYIFAGPRGVGKTTSARILAKSLNCIHGPTPEPCGICENCVEIRDGRSFDVIEIDGASNNSVDDIRDLREKVNFAPVKSHYKIYIIDEVHMLSTPAFNALLKTLEEPPAHVVFIMATTEMHKLPETILSRCQKYYFKKMTAEVIAVHLKKIAEQDGYSVEEGALYPIARAGDGSMRDAQSLLEQVLSFTQGNVTKNDALSQLGLISLENYTGILSSIADGNAAAIIDQAENAISQGADIPRYAAGLADIIRALRLILHGVPVREAAGFSRDEYILLEECAKRFTDADLGAFFKIVSTLQNELRYTQNERAVLEMALLDMRSARQMPSLSALISRLEGVTLPQGAAVPSVKDAVAGAAAAIAQRTGSSAPASVPQAPLPVPAESEQEIAAEDEADIPLPSNDEMMASKPDLSEYNVEHPVIDKLREIFHGEIIEKEK